MFYLVRTHFSIIYRSLSVFIFTVPTRQAKAEAEPKAKPEAELKAKPETEAKTKAKARAERKPRAKA